MAQFPFNYSEIEAYFTKAVGKQYQVISCREYVELKAKQGRNPRDKILVNRVDIDFSVKKAEPLIDIFSKLGVRATFFLRLHAPEYNPFSFENYRIIRKLIELGHELGYHSEIVDQAAIWGEDAKECLLRDIAVIEKAFSVKIFGAASHGGLTGLNNLDFWRTYTPERCGLLYEAYDQEPSFGLFKEALYVSDSEWHRWKCYDRGVLVQGDRRTLGEHLDDEPTLVYSTIHSDTYYVRHFYENER